MTIAFFELPSFISCAENTVGSLSTFEPFMLDLPINLVGDASHDFGISGAATPIIGVRKLLLQYLVIESFLVLLFLRVRKEIQL